jgi:hypothetical protein
MSRLGLLGRRYGHGIAVDVARTAITPEGRYYTVTLDRGRWDRDRDGNPRTIEDWMLIDLCEQGWGDSGSVVKINASSAKVQVWDR